MLNGSCLCGSIKFEILGEVTDIYQCHCSLCRKAQGSAGISACLCSSRDFRWLSGQQQIEVYQLPSGYRSVFCRICGSHVPDADEARSTYWIPAGLLDMQDPGLKVGAHVFVASKAAWDKIGDEGTQFAAGFPE